MNKQIGFLNIFMNALGIKAKNMENFLGCSKKTVYNYRKMEDELLPVEVWDKLFNFVTFYIAKEKIDSVKEIFEVINNLTPSEIIDAKVKFDEVSDLRLLEKNKKIKEEIEYQDSLARSMTIMEQYYASKDTNNEKNYIANVEKNIISIESKEISKLYMDLLERELNKILISEDFTFISYIRKYKNQ